MQRMIIIEQICFLIKYRRQWNKKIFIIIQNPLHNYTWRKKFITSRSITWEKRNMRFLSRSINACGKKQKTRQQIWLGQKIIVNYYTNICLDLVCFVVERRIARQVDTQPAVEVIQGFYIFSKRLKNIYRTCPVRIHRFTKIVSEHIF